MSTFTGIRCTNPEELRNRVLISDTMQITDPSYEQDAVVPIGNARRQPSAGELAPFLADERTTEGGTIEIVGFTAALRSYLRTYPKKIDATVCSANQLTTTENTENRNLRPGLHLDSKEGRPVATRLQSQRRIGLNFGPGLRFLLVGSEDAISLSKLLDQPDSHEPTTFDIRDAVKKQLASPAWSLRCLWIALEPGEAYLGPTEAIVHDGSTYGVDQPSTIQFWIGAPPPASLDSIV